MKVISIAGGSGSGKTTLANYILRQNPEENLLLSLDNYYLNKEEQIRRNGFCNYDHPLALDKEMLLKNIDELLITGETKIPQYCFKKRDRTTFIKIQRPSLLIVEGLYAVEYLKDIEAMKIFVEADVDLLLARRIKRDLESRGRSLDSILDQYFNEVKPAYNDHIIQQKQIADYFIKNNTQDIENLLSKIRELEILW